MTQENQTIIGVPADIAARIAEYLNEISAITADIENMIVEKTEKLQELDSELLETLQALDFVRQATADSARLVEGFSLSPLESVDSMFDKLHLERTASLLKLKSTNEPEVPAACAGDFHMF